MSKQRIIIDIDGGDLPLYKLEEERPSGPYKALFYFFEDIGYTVKEMTFIEKSNDITVGETFTFTEETTKDGE